MAIDETRAKLLDAAGYEFAEKGFEGATVRSICERAGANLASVNYHFGDKERLYEAVLMVAHHSRPLFAAAEAGRDEDPRAAFGRFVAYFLEESVFHQQSPGHQGVMLREVAAPSRASEVMIREVFRPQFEILLAILRRLVPGIDPTRAHAIGFSVIAQCLYYKLCRSVAERIIGDEAFGRLDATYLAEHITRFTLAALGQGEPFGGAPGWDTIAQHSRPMGEG